MFNVNLKFALRHLLKYRSYSLLNIVGLAFGMACALVIFLWIYNESQFDNFHEKKDRLYQVFRYEKLNDGNSNISATLSAPLATALLNDIPEIKAVTRVPWTPKKLFKYKDKAFFEQGIVVDSSFFEMFSFKLKQGDPKQILRDPGNIAISEKLAQKYFGNEDPIGKTIILKDWRENVYIIAGIFENVKENSTLQFDYASSFQVRLNQDPWLKDSWGNLILSIYIETDTNIPQAQIDQKIKNIFAKNHKGDKSELFTQRFDKVHLYPQEYKDKKTSGLIELLRLLAFTALIILTIACINFANLSTALSAKRSREIGIKKVIGSLRIKLIGQFFTESMILSLLAMLLTITCTELFLPKFNLYFSKSLELDYLDPVIGGTIVAIWLFTSFLAGVYPAFVISSFKPIAVLKSNTPSGTKGTWFKKSLVIFQFTMAITLIIFTFAVHKQTEYVKNKNLGLEKENIVSINFYDGVSKHMEVFKHDLEALPNIKNVTYCSMNPLDVGQSTKDPTWEGKKTDDDRWFSVIMTDFDFVKTFDIKMKEGRDFSSNYSTDSTNFLINEEAAKMIGFKSPIDQKLSMWGKSGKIIGVVKDFHINPLYMPIFPLIIGIDPRNTGTAFIKFNKGINPETLKAVEAVYKKYEPDYPFEYIFQTDFFEKSYKSNLFLIGTLSSIFSLLAIIISCLGLYGLTSYSAEQRTKEIGVRKVNGATLTNILRLLLLDFLKWVGLSYILGILIGSFLVSKFIDQYSYHTHMGIWIFIYAGLTASGIAVITVSWQAYKAANRNPVEALRYE